MCFSSSPKRTMETNVCVSLFRQSFHQSTQCERTLIRDNCWFGACQTGIFPTFSACKHICFFSTNSHRGLSITTHVIHVRHICYTRMDRNDHRVSDRWSTWLGTKGRVTPRGESGTKEMRSSSACRPIQSDVKRTLKQNHMTSPDVLEK